MQVFNVSGLIRSHFKNQWIARAGSQLGDGRLDSSSGQFRARYDSAETAFTQRALTFIDKQVFATLIPPLEARTFIPTNVRGNPGDETYLWRKYTRTGLARLFAPGAALDLPRASFYTEEIYQRYYPVGVKVVYDYFELLAIGSALANGQPVDLVGESLKAALEAIEKKLDIIAAFGTATPPTGFALEVEADVGITGLLNNPNATMYTIPVGGAGSQAWANKTSMEIANDLFGIVGGQVASTFKVHRPDTIIVPIAQFENQLTRPMSSTSQESIISYVQRTWQAMGQPVQILSWMYAAGAGAGSTDRMVAYKRDPRMLEHILAMDASPLAATTQGLETTQPVVAKTAGLVCRYPLALSYGDSI